MTIIEVVYKIIEEEIQLNDSLTIIVAASGGIDSMVLLNSLLQLKQSEKFDKMDLIVAHFNHQLRENSQRDAEHVITYCQKHQLPYIVEKWENPEQENSEAAARNARYLFLAKVYQNFDGDMLMTAHHLDDQIETFLMRFVRGTTLRGMNVIQNCQCRSIGIDQDSSITVKLVRPLLSIPKEAIIQYAYRNHIPFIEDESNKSNYYLRNRLRHEIVPRLMIENEQSYRHSDMFVHMLQTSYQAHLDHFFQAEPKLALPNANGGWTLSLPQWWSYSENQRWVYLSILMDERIIHRMGPYSLSLIDSLMDLMDPSKLPNRQIQASDHWIAKREYDILSIEPESQIIISKENQIQNLDLMNRWYRLSETERIGIFEESPHLNARSAYDVFHINLPSDKQMPIFQVRHRQHGDWMLLKKADGHLFHKKIARLFIDQKIPKDQRDKAWLLCTEQQECLWLIGYRKSITAMSQKSTDKTYTVLYEKTRENFDDL